MNEKKQKGRISAVIISVIFLVFIFAGCLLYVFLPKKDYSETEKRYLASAPSLSWSSVKSGKFSEDFEKFLADQTPFRSFFVSVNSYFEYIKGNNGSSGVYLCKNGWLIEKPFDESNRFDKNLKEIKDFTEKTNLPVTLIAVPEKGALYEKYLPKNSLKFEDEKYINTLADEFEKSEKVDFINLGDSFLKSENETYFYKTDHHWTSDGAFEAYRLFCLSKGLKEPKESDYNVETYPGFYGTSYSTSCYTLTKPDEVKIYTCKENGGKAKVTVTEGKKVTESDDMFFRNRLDEGDKYTVFLDGNHTRVDIKSGVNGKKLLIIKDSFAHCLAPFLAEQYGEIVMIDQRYYNGSVSKLIEEEKIDEIAFIYGVNTLAESRDISLY